jgi:hypothetical protein
MDPFDDEGDTMRLIEAFVKKYPNWQHSVAAFIAMLPLAYAEVPQFHAFVIAVLAQMPHLLKEGIFAAGSVYFFYRHIPQPNVSTATTNVTAPSETPESK